MLMAALVLDLAVLAPDTQFVCIGCCLVVVNNLNCVISNKCHPYGFQVIYLGTGSFENINGAKSLFLLTQPT